MGCASSTPMIATAGSEMLKAASHVAEDATKSAEGAVQDVTQTLGKGIEAAKESVGSAVTGIAHDLGNAFKEKTDALDEAKENLLGKLHMGSGGGGDGGDPQSATGKEQTMKFQEGGAAGNNDNEEEVDDKESDMEERISRAPTPALDVDSLRTSTPEPEIEQALANCHEPSPPTPKPTLSELEQLKPLATKAASLRQRNESSNTVETTVASMATGAAKATATAAAEPPVDAAAVTDGGQPDALEQPRPSTTDWERYADTLAHNRKYLPLDALQRAARLRRSGPQLGGIPPPTPGVAPSPLSHAPPPYREPVQPASLVARLRNNDDSAMSDPYYNSLSSPLQSNRSSARAPRRKLARAGLTPRATRKVRDRELIAPLIGVGAGATCSHKRSTASARGGGKGAAAAGRRFDFNPARMRIGSPIRTRSLAQSRVGSPRPAARRPQLVSCTGSPLFGLAHTGVLGVMPLARSHLSSPALSRSRERSRTSSPAPAVVAVASTSTATATATATTIGGPAVAAQPHSAWCAHNINHIDNHNDNSVLVRGRSSAASLSSASLLDDGSGRDVRLDSRLSHHLHSRSPGSSLDLLAAGSMGKLNHLLVALSSSVRNTSSFLSTPRSSPFSIRKHYSEYENKENTAFVADLSSVASECRSQLTPSPYKMRERCVVCYKKYVIK